MSALRIDINDPEDFDKMMKRFVKMVKKDGVLAEVRERRYFIKPSIKKRDAKKKNRKQSYNQGKNND